MNDIRKEYLRNHSTPLIAAVAVAQDLMRDDPVTLRAGYTLDNAVISAWEIFPEVERAAIRELLIEREDGSEEA